MMKALKNVKQKIGAQWCVRDESSRSLMRGAACERHEGGRERAGARGRAREGGREMAGGCLPSLENWFRGWSFFSGASTNAPVPCVFALTAPMTTTMGLRRRDRSRVGALCVNDDDRWDNLDSESKSTLLRKEEDKLMAAKNAGASL